MSDRTPEQIALLREGAATMVRYLRKHGDAVHDRVSDEHLATQAIPDPKPPLLWRKKEGVLCSYAIDGEQLVLRYRESDASVHSEIDTALIRQLAVDSYDTGELVVPQEAVNVACRVPVPDSFYMGKVLRAALPHLLAANAPEQLKPTWWMVVDEGGNQFGPYRNQREAQKDVARLDQGWPDDAPHRVVALAEVPNHGA